MKYLMMALGFCVLIIGGIWSSCNFEKAITCRNLFNGKFFILITWGHKAYGYYNSYELLNIN